MKRGATHVFTITTEYKDGLECVEFFRGSENECRDLAARFGGCAYDDRRTVIAMRAFVGPVKDWDDFLDDGKIF